MNRNRTLLLGLSLVPFLISACGFHLRGGSEIPSSLKVIYLKTNTPYASLETILRQTLKTSGITACLPGSETPPCQAQAASESKNLVLELSNLAQNNNMNIAALDASNQARVYTLYSSVTVTLSHQGKLFYGPAVLGASRTIRLGANQLWQPNNQINALNRAMDQDIVMQIYGILSSQKTADTISAQSPD